MKKNFLFRVDSGKGIGIGHILRCQSLALELIKNGNQVHFLTKEHPGHIIDEIDQQIQVIKLKSHFNYLQKIDDDYTTWNCDSDQNEFDRVQELIHQYNIDTVVLDHYGIGYKFDQLLFTEGYTGSVVDNFLLGPEYSLLSSEFAELKKKVKPIAEVKNILVFFGGNDLTNETLKVVQAFEEVPQEFKAKINCHIFIASNHTDFHEIKTRAEKLEGFQVYTLSPKFKGFLYHCDLFLGASGTTNWERCCLGKPTFLVTIADNQVNICEQLAKSKIVHNLGMGTSTTHEDWIEAIKLMKTDMNYIKTLSEKSYKIVDGLGTSRVAKILMENL